MPSLCFSMLLLYVLSMLYFVFNLESESEDDALPDLPSRSRSDISDEKLRAAAEVVVARYAFWITL